MGTCSRKRAVLCTFYRLGTITLPGQQDMQSYGSPGLSDSIMLYSLFWAVLSLRVDVPIRTSFRRKCQKSDSDLLAYVEKGTYALCDRKVKGFRHSSIQELK